jgi:hypothetical protein
MTNYDPLNPLANRERYRPGGDMYEPGQSVWPLLILVGLIAGLALILSI